MLSETGTNFGDKELHDLISNVAIVLVEPREAGNMGSVARAMNNMGLKDLVLVRPRPHLVPQSYRMALNGAPILERAAICDDVSCAVADFDFVVGTTRRSRSVRRVTVSPREGAAEIAPLLRTNRCAVLFGREDRGLTNEEVELCQRLVTIPTSPGAESLNLAQAVLVTAYEVFLAAAEETGRTGDGRSRKLASSSELEGLYGHMEEALLAIGYLDANNPKHMMRVIREVFARAGLDAREVSALRGIFRQLNWHSGSTGLAAGEGSKRAAVR